jgi:GR25 family glycosyltransferase involved in LPS biosynthesis
MKAFIIHLPNREHSVSHANLMLNKLKEFGFDAYLFAGTDGEKTSEIFTKESRVLYPYGIKTKFLNKEEISKFLRSDLPENFWEDYGVSMTQRYKWSEKELSKVTMPGVKGCFHSHYRLWKNCIDLDEPIAIFEDDVVFYREFFPVEFENVLIVSLGKSSFYNEPYTGYLNNPDGPPVAKSWKNFSMPGASGYVISPKGARKLYKFYRRFYMPADNAINSSVVNIQIHSYIMGRNTLPEEGNISMTRGLHWR